MGEIVLWRMCLKRTSNMTDTEAYGDLYQWGRLSDGHEKRESGTTTTLSSTDDPEHNKFILSPYQPAPSTGDWRNPQNDNLWQGVNGINNPCPEGFRLPTKAELQAEVDSWTTQNIQGAFASPLRLPAAGARLREAGSIYSAGSYGAYWTSTTFNGTEPLSNGLSISESVATIHEIMVRATGLSVRCIQD
ncbi:MAG: hypothetical protein D3916_03065 [Candidatus Electrothrix sp. MAN1_4]|nr:hypothetical protein [Candidatus Electrothrix sp. MAN1_4]